MKKDIFGDELTSDNKSDFASLFEGSMSKTETKLSIGDRIKAEVLTVGRDEVFVGTGTMNDGVVLKSELKNELGEITVKVGDILDLYVTYTKGAEIRLSPKPTAKNLADSLEDAFDMMVSVEGKVTEVCNGGFRVNIMGKTAFCPISQMDSKRIEDASVYVGRKYDFMITQFSEKGRNIIVSRRKLLDEERATSQVAFEEDVKIGQVIDATVSRLEKFGAFVEVASGLDGLVHISEVAWSRLESAAEVLSVGQKVRVKVLKKEKDGDRLKLSLSIKQAELDPWSQIDSLFKVGSVAAGRVTRCMAFGAFVEIHPGIEGLIPLSEMSYTKRVVKSDDLVKPGDKIAVMIKDIDAMAKRVSLSLKDAGTDPWALIPQKFPVGSQTKGKVQKRETFGLFIELEPGVVGLLHKSKANDAPDFPYEKLKPGDEVTVQIAEIQYEARKLSLAPPGDEIVAIGDYNNTSAQMGTLADKFKDLFKK